MGISRKNLRYLIRSGKLPATKFGREYRISMDDYDQFDFSPFLSKNKKTTKNPDCTYYNKCLSIAARKNGVFFCDDCEQYSPVDIRDNITWAEIRGIYRMWGEAFSGRGGGMYLKKREFYVENRRKTNDIHSTGNCNDCPYWKRRNHKKKGVKISGGVGKCTRPDGHCNPEIVKKKIGEN